ncbi:MAG: response regulator transcription factor [Burkholderiaceae bacterium]
MRLLLLEDDLILGEGLRDFLQHEGHVVDWVVRLVDLARVAKRPFDVLLVDWQLPDGSGLSWVKTLRETGDMTPAIMMTARDLLEDRIQGLDTGVDDYLVKPFRPEELAARIRAVRRRAVGSASSRLVFGKMEVDLATKTATIERVAADLTAREWALIEALALRAGQFVSKTELDRLFKGEDVEAASNALEVHVHNLRRKLGRETIETVRGRGYRLRA